MKYSPVDINNNIKKYEFNFKKKFGQNFIADENIINSIVEKSDINSDTLVVEIGPGAGSLTYKLSQKAKWVLCYEIDETVKEMLSSNLSDCNNVTVLYEDFLKANLIQELKKYDYKSLYLVANLPYYITTPIITKIIEDKINIDKMVVMVQKEVGDRFSAKPNTKNYNSLSLYLQYNFNIKKLMDVSRNVFIPRPNVDSIVVEFAKKDKYPVDDLDKFYKLIRDSFTQKRKNLKNNLKTYDLAKVGQALEKYGFDLNARAEQLPLEIFVDISNNL